jgi:hypothetical protein
LDFAKNVLPLLEPKLLVMWEKIGEALQMVYRANQFAKTWYNANRSGAKQCLLLNGIFLVWGSSAIQ